jgi:hypothetical protein
MPSIDEPMRFAEHWIASWNRRDIEAVLAHYRDDASFRSPIAASVAGTPLLSGKAALRGYWSAALARTASLHFTLVAPIWDPERRVLVLLYEAELGAARKRAGEIMSFDESGKVASGEALYGAAL